MTYFTSHVTCQKVTLAVQEALRQRNRLECGAHPTGVCCRNLTSCDKTVEASHNLVIFCLWPDLPKWYNTQPLREKNTFPGEVACKPHQVLHSGATTLSTAHRPRFGQRSGRTLLALLFLAYRGAHPQHGQCGQCGRQLKVRVLRSCDCTSYPVVLQGYGDCSFNINDTRSSPPILEFLTTWSQRYSKFMGPKYVQESCMIDACQKPDIVHAILSEEEIALVNASKSKRLNHSSTTGRLVLSLELCLHKGTSCGYGVWKAWGQCCFPFPYSEFTRGSNGWPSERQKELLSCIGCSRAPNAMPVSHDELFGGYLDTQVHAILRHASVVFPSGPPARLLFHKIPCTFADIPCRHSCAVFPSWPSNLNNRNPACFGDPQPDGVHDSNPHSPSLLKWTADRSHHALT